MGHAGRFVALLAVTAIAGCRKDAPRPASAPAAASRPAAVRVAAVQCYSRFGDVTGNRAKLAALVRKAAAGAAKIVVLPEAAVTGYLSADLKKTWRVGKRFISDGLTGVDPAAAAETVPGESTKLFGKLADELDVYLTATLVEVDKVTGDYYNTSVLFGPGGNMLIHYRKRNPWWWAEVGWASPGDLGNPVVDTPYGRLGLLICFDIHRQADIMGRKDVDILLYSIAWVEGPDSEWFAKDLPAVAKEQKFNIVGANWTVPPEPAPAWHGYGQTRIIAADGRILARARDDLADEIIYADLPVHLRD